MYWNDKPYHSLDYELKSQYGEKIYKIALDAGMTCPNRDGSCGSRGCIFCSAGGSGDFAVRLDTASLQNETMIKNQISSQIKFQINFQIEKAKQYSHDKKTGNRYIAYFQAYTNTYAPVIRLETLYRSALDEPDIVGISVATRPDCLGDDVLLLLDRLNKEYSDKFIWIELGLQTIHEPTAAMIRRGYSLSVFEKAVKYLKNISIPIITHVILGLPGEDKKMMLETCRFLGNIGINGIKLQLLHVLKNTDLVELYEKKSFEILDFMEYIDIVISCLEILPPEIVIHRVTGDGPKDLLIAPLWSLNKKNVLNTLHKEMKQRGTCQSALWLQKDCVP